METKVELIVLEDISGTKLGYLMRTHKGEAVFSKDLSNAATYRSRKAASNAITRIKGVFELRYREVTLEVKGGFHE